MGYKKQVFPLKFNAEILIFCSHNIVPRCTSRNSLRRNMPVTNDSRHCISTVLHRKTRRRKKDIKEIESVKFRTHSPSNERKILTCDSNRFHMNT
jgi:hypothetical protein